MSRTRAWLAVGVAASSSFLFVVDSAFVALSLPEIEDRFSSSPRSLIGWVATAFMVMQSSFLLIAGRLGDQRGRRRCFLGGVAGFGLGAVLTGLAPNVPLMIAARAGQGIAAAFLTSGALAIVLPMFPRAEAPMVVGAYGGVGSVAGWLGPVIGPLFVALSWRAPFFAVGPVCAAVFLVGRRVLPEQYGDDRHGPTDRIGLVLGPPALGALMLVLSLGGRWGWTSTATLCVGGVSLVLVGALVRRSIVAERPLLDLSSFRFPRFSANLAAGAFQQAGFFGWYVTAPLVMENVWHWPVGRVGLALALSQVLSTIGAPLGGHLARRYGNGAVIAGGGLIAAAGCAWLLVTAGESVDVASSYVPAALALGFGTAVSGTLATGAALTSLPEGRWGEGNSLQQQIRRMAGAIGVAVAVALLGDAKGPALLPGARAVWVMATVAHLAVIAPLVVERSTRRRVTTLRA